MLMIALASSWPFPALLKTFSSVGLIAALVVLLIVGGLILKASVRMSQELRRSGESRRRPHR
jgi:hypothetical protein